MNYNLRFLLYTVVAIFWTFSGKAVEPHSAYSEKTISFTPMKWHKLSEFGEGVGAHGGLWECPDLIEMETPDGGTKWMLLVSINPGGPDGGSATQYFPGDFLSPRMTCKKRWKI